MFTLIRKDLPLLLMNAAFIIPLLTLYWFLNRYELDIDMVIAAGGFIFLVVISGILNVEIYEHRNNGYSFLKILPLNNETVIVSKIIPPLALTILLVIYNSVIFSYFTTQTVYLEISRTYIYMCGFVCLVIVLLIYFSVFLFGLSSFIRLGIIIFIITLMGGPILVRELLIPGREPGREFDVNRLYEMSHSLEWYYILVAALLIYILMAWLLIILTRKNKGITSR